MRLFYLLLVCSLLLDSRVIAQTASPNGSPFPSNRGRVPGGNTPAPKGSASKLSPEEQKAKVEEAIALLQERIGEATDKVMNRIINQERDLRIRFNYFQKPERLNPNNFGSKEEIQPWIKLTDELRQSRDLAAKFYGNASEDLERELIAQRIAPPMADALRREIISSFPWDEIAKKNELLNTYITDHRQLLDFFDQNWATWNKEKPYFSEPKAESNYEKLCGEITGTGKQIEELYVKINIAPAGGAPATAAPTPKRPGTGGAPATAAPSPKNPGAGG
jgi:hypothetical protein